MKIAIENFSGIAPLINPRRLADGLAQTALDCLFEKKSLRALRAPEDTGFTCSASTETIYPYQGTVIEYDEPVDIAETPVLNDEYDRIFLSDAAYPKVRSGGTSYRLGIPRPSAAPGVTASDVPDADDSEEILESETVYYTFTYVDAFGAEGPNSPVSSVIEKVRDTQVDLTFPAVPSGSYNLGSGLIRIYRSNTGTSETDFQFVTEQPIATASYADNVPSAALQEILASATHIGPPDDDTGDWPEGPLQGLCNMGNGILAGFTPRTLHFCDPFLPHAWPLEYRIPSRYRVIGIVPISDGLLVVTQGKPFLVVGNHPSSLATIPVEGDAQLPCIAKRSLVDMGDYAMYATDRGLALVEGNRARLVTDPLMDKDTWETFVPTSLISDTHNGRYIGFYDTGSAQGGIIFDPQGGRNALSLTSQYADTVYHGVANGALYMKQGTEIHEWDAGDSLTYTWKSKIHVTPQDVNFGYFELLGEVSSTDVTLTYDSNTYNFTATTQYTVLPGFLPVNEWTVQLQGTDELILAMLHEDLEA